MVKSFKAKVRNSLSKRLDKTKSSKRAQRKLIPAEINMLSGCHDGQTAHGISNTHRFKFPHANGDGSPGGAFTSAVLELLYEYAGDTTTRKNWVDILIDVRDKFEQRTKHVNNMREQTPQITSSRMIDETKRFRMINKGKDGTPGKKHAVLIGINYTDVADQSMRLNGSHNDVANMKKYLMDIHGFKDENISILLDDVDLHHPNPTKENIMSALEEVVQSSQKGDSIFVLYSGHGGQIEDQNGDEADGLDEVLVPLDYDKEGAGEIVDDDLYIEFVKKVPKDVLVTCLFDCCHSGTVLDLPYMLELEEQELIPEEKAVSSIRGLEKQDNSRSLLITEDVVSIRGLEKQENSRSLSTLS